MTEQKENLLKRLKQSEKRSKAFWFIWRWWLIYGVFGGTIFICGLVIFFLLFCDDCYSFDPILDSFSEWILVLFPALIAGALLGAFAGLILGFANAIIFRIWVYYPVDNVQYFQANVIISNLLIPTSLMVFSTSFLVSLARDFSALPTMLYIPVLAYSIAVIVGLLVSGKFLKWWL